MVLFRSTLSLLVSESGGDAGSTTRKEAEILPDAFTLLREVYTCLLLQGCTSPRELLCNEGGLAPSEVSAFEEVLRNDGMDKKARQRAMRRLLEPLWRKDGKRSVDSYLQSMTS
uniref:Uncharacterized protein n=2 Tax=Chrysotila carterae TaxID=13221 RepID=A0A7S4BEQ6_CHRCT